uniref:Secreted protein n=1 Tax=Steinernema glaseri TaxID=37863 RepID=A0A1I8AWG3_9BILA
MMRSNFGLIFHATYMSGGPPYRGTSKSCRQDYLLYSCALGLRNSYTRCVDLVVVEAKYLLPSVCQSVSTNVPVNEGFDCEALSRIT